MEAKLLRVASPPISIPTAFRYLKPICLLSHHNSLSGRFGFLNSNLPNHGIQSLQASAISVGRTPVQQTKLHSISFSNFNTEKAIFQPVSLAEKFASYLEHCSDIVSLRTLHASIFTFELQNNIFVGSKLLNCYAKLGFLTDSRWVFDKIVNNSLSLWNSILVGYFRAGYHDEVLVRYLDLRQRNIGVNGSAIMFSLKSCTELGSLQFGRGIHVDALKFGMSADRFVGSSLVGLYSTYGDTDSASKVFDEIIERDVVAYTSMITGYAQSGYRHAYEAFGVVRAMQEEELCPNRVTLVTLLQAAGHLDALEEGQSIHGYAIRRGIGSSDEVFETSLMDMYIKCGAMNTAASIFSKMSTRTVASWNALIAGHLQMGRPLEALNLFFIMVQQNLEPDLITLANGILSCADLKYLNEGKSIHGYIIRTGLRVDIVATTALIDLYSKCNSLTHARKIFNRMEAKDVISFNVMMAGYLQNGFACEAMNTFYEMVGTGIIPNLSTILSILSVFSDLKDVRQGRGVHGYIFRHGLDLHSEIANQVIYMYAKCGYIDSCGQVFDRTKYKDLVSWTSIMMGYVHHGRADKAIALFRLMQREKVTADSVTFLSLLQGFSQLGCLSLAKEVHCRIYRVSLELEMPVINSLITTYGKCGKLNIASALFEHMSERCLTSWNTMIAAYGMHGKCVEALKLFDRMKEEKVAPDEVTFTSLISACSHSGLVEQGLNIFRSMKEEYFLIPIEEHYGCMVDLLSRAGQIEEGYDLLNCLPLRQRTSALGALLAACRVHKNTQMGEVIGRQLLNLEPDNPTAYGLLSNLYTEVGKWNDAASIRTMSKDRGLKKTPGYSLIEIDKQEFLKKERIDETDSYTLDGIRHSLIRQEDSIIFSLLERAQYCFNVDTYDPNAFFMDGFHGSLVDFMVKETEKLHARVGRYKSPDEHPFFPDDLPDTMLPPLQYPQVLHPIADAININNKIWDMYFGDLLTRLVREGDNGNCGSAAVCDTICLQALSKRIHYGKFVAEAKFRASPAAYEAAIRAQDRTRLMDLLTYPTVEEAIKRRVEMKAKTYGKEVTDNNNVEEDGADPVCKIKPSLVADLYGDGIMPLTKEVQVEYLLRRLD
ncbi:unnamed protein product [Camellia sinensis]